MKKTITVIKNWLANLIKGIWRLNWEAKLGLLLLTPPIIASINKYLERGFSHCIEVEVFHLSGNIMKIYIDSDLSTEPIFYGLLALAGVFLIRK